ncbi:Rhamnogalacturonate lyase [Thalictrum thalictroides]|uniref:rhamnogalacturonan endolyase n=1 Tax=Thalictrum thalictroides TaxID=46969 RepID=A0A7J6UV09_THATH|nr:Rhamnogalacturonate lyase [Thalictrum thalictroides]
MAKKVILITQPSYVTLDNGLAKLTISKPAGSLTGISFGGMDNLLDLKSSQTTRGYWDINWNLPGGQDRYLLLKGMEYSVVNSSNDCVELSFRSNWNSSARGTTLPLSIDRRYIMKSGVSGFYCYAIYERSTGLPAFDLVQTRMVFILRRDLFHYMAITDNKQRIMPMPEDRLPNRCKELIVPEAVLLTNPINPDLKGQVDDKYQYSMDNKDGGVHGWISSGPVIGFWIIHPSNESRNGGPTKQNLTCHTGPACLAMFHGTHYIGNDIVAHFSEGEAWRKVFGPFFVYLNTTSNPSDAHSLWIDAKRQRLLEVTAWPYNFVSSPYFLSAKERGSTSGRLFVQDKSVSGALIPAKNVYVGLSVARTEGGWEVESKGYQFWVQTDSDGSFIINNVIPGVYGLHGWVPGFIGNFLNKTLVTISPGSETELGNLIYIPPRSGPTLWEIGYPDRSAIGFYVPDVNSMYINPLYINSPEKVLVTPEFFLILTDANGSKTTSRRGPEKYLPTTWQVNFNLNSVTSGTYKLRIAMASAIRCNLQVHMNSLDESHLVFQVLNLGMDNIICRHGIHGLYRLFNIDISSTLLIKGDNIMFLTNARGGDPMCGIVYDYIRLESPATFRLEAPTTSEWSSERR